MQFIKIHEVVAKTCISETSIWRMRKKEDFPKPIKINGINLWDVDDINTWMRKVKRDAQKRNLGV